MSDIAIRVEGLGKRYRIGARRNGDYTLREAIVNTGLRATSLLRHRRNSHARIRNSTDFWALKEVSFGVRKGEVIGVVGRNGAGKSTLLKILSRITKPTEGRAELNGRTASLLEVGTGFHPELTGRENIYLNGAVLGMHKAEIKRKFDEIVGFAEIDQFLDTPVKHYSSGMYVRLAFAVAAHLDPEILLVDEVLAVGDAVFQEKCLGKMGDVARGGRTVFLVSHNMAAIQSLCSSALLLQAGRLQTQGDPKTVVAKYLSDSRPAGNEISWSGDESPGNHDLRLMAMRAYSSNPNDGSSFLSSHDCVVEMEFRANVSHSALCVGFDLVTSEGAIVLRSYQTDMRAEERPTVEIGANRWCCTIPRGLLNAGEYRVCPRIGMHNMYWIAHLDAVIAFEIVLAHGVSSYWHSLDRHSRPGVVAPLLTWNVPQAAGGLA